MGNFWKYALAFALGAAAGAVVCKNSAHVRSICTKAIGGALDVKDMVMEKAEIIKESAEDLVAEADAKRKKDTPEA